MLDLEDLRRALGLDQVIPLGVSYGGQVAGEYLRRFPGSVRAAVLDSTSPVEGVDALGACAPSRCPASCARCAPPGCQAFPCDPRTGLARLVRRLVRRPLRGTVVLPDGRRRPAPLTASGLFLLVALSDQDPFLRTELPAGIDAALRGDAAPLLRQLVRAGGLANEALEDFSRRGCSPGAASRAACPGTRPPPPGRGPPCWPPPCAPSRTPTPRSRCASRCPSSSASPAWAARHAGAPADGRRGTGPPRARARRP
ncbi:MAG: alpha/beta hydrolase [Actinomycetota bacterium]|nr:alpha/beta hydrolase [Actinomycetota bacterium]